MPTYSGITYTEKDISVGQSGVDDFDLSPDNLQLAHQKCVEVAWTDRYTFVTAIKNTNNLCPVAGCYALIFHVEPVGKPSAENTWPTARITIGYKNLAYDPTVNKEEIYDAGLYSPDMPLEQSDGSTLAWTFILNDATKAPTVTFGMILYTVVLHNQSSFDRTSADAILNTVNNATFNGWDTGHVLFEGYNSTKRTSVSGGVSYENAYRFRWLQIKHNDEFNPDTGLWEEIQANPSFKTKFDPGDFSTLGL